MVATQAFLGTAATLIASSSGFLSPLAVRSVAVGASASSSEVAGLKMSVGSDYIATLPGTPFPNGLVFDPLEFSDNAEPSDIKLWREAEIKHGRLAMLATVGVIVAEEYHPFFTGPDYTGHALDFFREISAQYPEFWVYAFLGMAFVEFKAIVKAYKETSGTNGEGDLKEDYSPGELGFDPLHLKPKNEKEFFKMKTRELNNGRLAMIGIAGMLAQELVNPAAILG